MPGSPRAAISRCTSLTSPLPSHSVSDDDAVTGAFVKIRRALEHRDALLPLIAKEREQYPHRLESRSNRGASSDPLVKVEWRVTGLRPELPPVCSAVFADFIQNMRTALDHMAWDLIIDDSRTRNARSVYFPLVTEATKLPRLVSTLQRRYAPEVAEVIASVQPCQATDPYDHPLGRLVFLSNADKHRTVQVIRRAQVDLGPVRVVPEPVGGVRSWVKTGAFEPEDVIATVEWERPLEAMEMEVQPTFAYGEALVVGDGQAARPVLLSEVGEQLERDVLDIFRRMYGVDS